MPPDPALWVALALVAGLLGVLVLRKRSAPEQHFALLAAPELVPVASSSNPVASGVRREASMRDLQELDVQLQSCRGAQQAVAAVELLQQHIQRHTRTSPWVFLELHQALHETEQPEQWTALRSKFKTQFGQTAPDWSGVLPVTSLEADPKLKSELTRLWPGTPTRLWIERWLLGTGSAPGTGPPMLDLGIYREMLWLDRYLGEIIREITQRRRAAEK